MSKRQPTEPELPTIDPTALATVSGGAGGSADPAVMQALTGVLDSLKSLGNQPQQGGFGPNEMMMFMMMMGNHHQAPAAVAQAPGTIGGYAGYTIDGVYYPFR